MKYRSRRKPTDYNAVLVWNSSEYPVVISDASPTGVKVSGLGGYVAPEAEVCLVVSNQRLASAVQWVDRDVLGLRFLRPLDKKTLSVITRSLGGASRTYARWQS